MLNKTSLRKMGLITFLMMRFSEIESEKKRQIDFNKIINTMRFNKRKISISDEFDVFDLEPWKNVSSNSIKEKMISPKQNKNYLNEVNLKIKKTISISMKKNTDDIVRKKNKQSSMSLYALNNQRNNSKVVESTAEAKPLKLLQFCPGQKKQKLKKIINNSKKYSIKHKEEQLKKIQILPKLKFLHQKFSIERKVYILKDRFNKRGKINNQNSWNGH